MSHVSSDKLKGWRLRKGWTLQEMAKAMEASGHKISKAALGQFEKERSRPKASTLRAIAAVFGIRPHDLFESEFGLNFIGFRSLASLSETKRSKIKAEMTWRGERREKLVTLSGANRPDWKLSPFHVIDLDESETIATQLRTIWDIGRDAIGNLADVIENHGGEVIEIPAEKQFSGLSAYSNDGRPFLAVQQRDSDGARQRMDLAHELAHVIIDGNSPVDDEQFAHRFAGTFLLPREIVIAELGESRRDLNIQELKALKLKYGVSIQGWVRRAKDCGIITDATYTSLSIRISKAGMRKDEGAPYVPLERLDRDFRLAARAVTEGGLPIDEAASLAGIDPADLSDPSDMKKPPIRPNLRKLNREERRKIAHEGAKQAALSYEENPDDLAPEIMDLIED